MKLFTREELHILTEPQEGPCVSIFMPTHRTVVGLREDRLRFKNLVKDAEESLIASGQRAPEARSLLAPATELIERVVFWEKQRDGLAMFIAPELLRYYLLPVSVEQLVVVSDRFHVKPLLALLLGDGRFYVLALSQNRVRLLQGTRFRVSEVEVAEMPPSLADALRYEEQEKQLQFHTGAASPEHVSRGERRPGMFHGHGVGHDDTKDRILRYFQQIDRSLHEVLRHEQAPLLLAGVDYLLPIYQEANTYRYLVDQGITGNPELLGEQELHELAWPLVQPYFLQSQQEAVARYGALTGTGKTSCDLKEIVPAACYGRVDSLFVAVWVQQWGTFDREANIVELHPEAQPGDEDLLDLAAIQTLRNGGAVYAVPPEEVPDAPPVAALYRY